MGSKGPKNGKVTVGGKSAARNNWDSRTPRSAELAAEVAGQQRAAVERVIPWRSRKNTRRWCKGKPGREHQVAVTLRARWGHDDCHQPRWRTTTGKPGREWLCYHVESCTACGKVLRCLKDEECPIYQELRRPLDSTDLGGPVPQPQLPPEIEAIVEEGCRHPERRKPRPHRQG